jgi:hypothetical protein
MRAWGREVRGQRSRAVVAAGGETAFWRKFDQNRQTQYTV